MEHNDTQHKGFVCDTQRTQLSAKMTLSITILGIEEASTATASTYLSVIVLSVSFY